MNTQPQSAPTTTVETPPQKCSKCYTQIAVRLLMGLGFTVFGLNGFLHFIPQPKEAMPPVVTEFMKAMMDTGYLFPLVMGTQLVVGIMLLTNLFAPLALVLIMPVLVNIICFHIFLQPAGIAPGAILMLMELYLAWTYRASYAALLRPKAQC